MTPRDVIWVGIDVGKAHQHAACVDTVRLRRDIAELSTPEELVVELSLLVSHRTDLMGEWVRGINRLRELLTAVFPALERAFDYSTRSALILAAGFQTPQAVRDAG